MPIYSLNGTLLADGSALRGCCCSAPPPASECALVIVRLWVSSYSIPSGSGMGSGSHSSKAEIFDSVCSSGVFASRGSQYWSDFYNAQNATSNSCYATGCDGATASVYNAGADLQASIPWARGAAQRRVAELTFDDSRAITLGFTVWVKWSLSVRFLSVGGGPPGPQTLVPFCRIGFTRGHAGIYESNGVDRTWPDIITDTRTYGQTLTDLTAGILLT
jgi:hypothetical protein